MSGRQINEDRQNALALGLRTYTGAQHSKCGTTERYVSGGGCVRCARALATEQREARKFLKAHAEREAHEAEQITDGVEEINQDREDPIDNVPEAEVDDAKARARAALEDLM